MAATQLKHDAQGFLLGDKVQFDELLKSSRDMAEDVQAIRGLLERGNAGRARAPNAVPDVQAPTAILTAVAGAVAAKAANDAAPVTVQKAVKPSNNGTPGTASHAVVHSTAKAAVSAAQKNLPERSDAQKSLPERGADGRFTKGAGAAGAAGAGGGASSAESGSEGTVGRLLSAIKSAGQAEEVDPAIKAVNEVARPMARGYEAVMGGTRQERKQERWYRRFWASMKRSQEDEQASNKAIRKSLKVLEAKPTGAEKGSGGIVAMILTALTSVLVGALSKILPKSLLSAVTGGGLPGIPGGAPAGQPGGAKGSGKGGGKGVSKGARFKGALGRIPMLGAAFALAGGAAGVWESESSDMTRAQKDRATGSAVGGTAGTLGGMLAGAKLGAAIGTLAGPIGTAIGGVVGGAAGMFFGDKAGQVLGETVGGWVTSLRDADIPGKFSAGIDYLKSGWDQTMSTLGAAWTAGKDYLKGAAKDATSWVGKKLEAANTAVRDATGVDVKAGASRAVDATARTAQKAGEVVKGAANSAGQAIQQSTVGRGVAVVANAAKNAWQAGDRKKAVVAEMDAQGITDKNERAMLLAQVDHESNGFRSGEESFNYRSADRIAEVSKTAAKKGKPAIEAAMKQGPEAVAELMYGGRMGNTEAGDGYKYRGRGSIQITGKDNYKKLGDKLGLDLVNNPDLLMDPAISAKASVQWWKDNGVGKTARAGDVAGATKIINGGKNGLDHRTELFAKYSKDPLATSTSAASTAAAMPQPVAVAAAPAVNGTVSAHAPLVSVSGASTPLPAVPAAPKVPTAVAGAGAGRGSSNPAPANPGQDLTDRRLAHITTGGIGGAA